MQSLFSLTADFPSFLLAQIAGNPNPHFWTQLAQTLSTTGFTLTGAVLFSLICLGFLRWKCWPFLATCGGALWLWGFLVLHPWLEVVGLALLTLAQIIQCSYHLFEKIRKLNNKRE